MEKKFDFIDAIMALEGGDMTDSECIELFQYLVDTGMAWTLQGSYGRMAQSLIDAGLVIRRDAVASR